MFARALPRLALVFSALAFPGCDSDTDAVSCLPLVDSKREDLVDHDLWRPTELSTDPWQVYRPAGLTCTPESRQAEDFGGYYSYGVDSLDCLYSTVSQPSQAGICEGDVFFAWLWAFNLNDYVPLQECEQACLDQEDCELPPGCEASEPVAHIEFQIGDEHLYGKAVAIPNAGGYLYVEVKTQKPHPKGTPVYFHIRNHGDNSYQLIEISRCQQQPCGPESTLK